MLRLQTQMGKAYDGIMEAIKGRNCGKSMAAKLKEELRTERFKFLQ